MSKPLADYVKLPQLEEYKEWFKDFADLYREDGILQVTWKTLDGPMQHSGMSPTGPLASWCVSCLWTSRTRSSSSPTSATAG